jgi:hypothetical protein
MPIDPISDSSEVDAKTDAKDFLLDELRHLADSFWKSEQTGETRVNWLIGLIGAAGAILAGSRDAPQSAEA